MIHCLHGAVGSPRDWDLFKDRFGEKTHPLDLWDLFKNSTPSLPEAGQAIADQASPNEILLGYSMGGRLALHALLSSPEKWRAAIIVGAHPGLTEGRPDRLRHDEKWASLAEQDWPGFLKKWNQQTILSFPPKGLQQASAKDQSAVAASFRHWSLGTQNDLRSSLSAITCPVLWLTGEKDRRFTALGREATHLIPNSVLGIIQESGHRVPWEQPTLFTSRVRRFLERNC